MTSYRFTTKAYNDLDQTTKYIFERNPPAADNFLTRLDEICSLLAAHPGLGRARSEFGENVRSFPMGNYLIFYAPSKERIIVLRLLYGGRNIPREFE